MDFRFFCCTYHWTTSEHSSYLAICWNWEKLMKNNPQPFKSFMMFTKGKSKWYLHISLSIQGAIGDSTATAGFLGLRLDKSKCEDFFLFHNLSLMLLLGSTNSSKKNHTNVNSNLRSEMLRAVLESIAFSQKQLVRKHSMDFVIYKARSRLEYLEKVYASKFLT